MLTTPELRREAQPPHRLRELMPRWLATVPLYRGVADRRGPWSSFDSPDVMTLLRELPLITKEDLRRDFPRNFLPADLDLETLLAEELVEVEHTSGSSGQRIPLLLAQGWWAAQEARALRLNRTVAQVLDEWPHARRVTLNSPFCSNEICYAGVPSRAERTIGDALFLSLSRQPFLWGEAELARMAQETVAWEPRFLDVDPVYGAVFARYCERTGIRLPSLRFILASYEFVSGAHRRLLERAFGVPVFNLYGSTETGHLLMEDERGEMVPSLETAFLELPDPDPGGVGELVVTTLTHEYMPLVRYRIGDLVERRGPSQRVSYLVHGRTVDAFTLADGARLTTLQVDECFTGIGGIAHYQLTQANADDWVLHYAPDGAGPDRAGLRELEERLAARLALSGSLTTEARDAFLPGASGKFRLGQPLPESAPRAA